MKRPTLKQFIFETTIYDAPPENKVWRAWNDVGIATLTDLVISSKHAHWNVTGPQFLPLHDLFEEVYVILSRHLDIIAERMVALNNHIDGRLQCAAKCTILGSYDKPGNISTGMDDAGIILDRLEVMSGWINDQLKATNEEDPITGNLMQDLGHQLDKLAWKLRATLLK